MVPFNPPGFGAMSGLAPLGPTGQPAFELRDSSGKLIGHMHDITPEQAARFKAAGTTFRRPEHGEGPPRTGGGHPKPKTGAAALPERPWDRPSSPPRGTPVGGSDYGRSRGRMGRGWAKPHVVTPTPPGPRVAAEEARRAVTRPGGFHNTPPRWQDPHRKPKHKPKKPRPTTSRPTSSGPRTGYSSGFDWSHGG